MTLRVVFSHGKDSEPWGHKILALAETARGHGCRSEEHTSELQSQ